MSFNESSRRPVVRRMVIGLAAAALAVSACGSSDDSDSADDTSADTADDASTDTVTDTSAADSADTEPADTEPADTDATDSEESDDPQELKENQPVSIEGDPLIPFNSDEVEDPAVGEAAPIISGASFDGTPITVGGTTENPTLVVFLAHWCPHCNDEIPELIELQESGDLPEGLDVVGVSTAVDSGAPNYPPSEWVVEKGWPWPIMADDEENSAVIAMGGTAFPFAAVLDADGTVLARRAGGAPAAETQVFLEDALANAAAAA